MSYKLKMTSELFNSFNINRASSEINSSKDNDFYKSKEKETKKEEKNNDNSKTKNKFNSEKNEDNSGNNKYVKLYEKYLFADSEELKEFICPLCQKIFDEPTMELCGCHKICCKICLDEFFEKHGKICPFSNKAINQDPQPVPVINYTINLFEIKCRNYKYGCGWRGKCGKYKEHLKKYCLKEIIKCNNIGCNELIMKENMNRHLKVCKYRYILCKLCNSKVQFIDRKKHEEICTNRNDEDCPQGCGEELDANLLKAHINNICSLELLECPFKYFGCKEKLNKEQMEKHKIDDMNNHILLFGERIIKTEEEIKNIYKLLENRFDSNNKDNKSKKSNSSYNLKEYLFEEKNKELNMENMNILSSGLGMEISPKINYDNSNNYCIFNNENDNSKVEVLQLFEGDNSYELKSKLSNSNSIDSNKTNNSFLNQKRKIINNNSKYNNKDKDKEKDNDSQGIKAKNNSFLNSKNLIDNNDFFDYKYIPKDKFEINHNTITSINMNNKEHYYIFSNEKYEINKDSSKIYKISIKLNENIYWLAFGICDKKKVEDNKFKFAPSKYVEEARNNGSYILSVNSMIWNSNNSSECKKLKVDPKSLGKAGKEIELQFIPNKNIMHYYIENKLLASLTNVKLFQSEVFTPCIIFLHNCSINVTFDYNI